MPLRAVLLLLLAPLVGCGQPAQRAPRGEGPVAPAPAPSPPLAPSAAPTAPVAPGKPSAGALRIGAIADCQYADQEDNGRRLYRRSPDKLRAAVEDLDAARPAFTVHLGDFIDQGWESFNVVEPLYQSLAAPALHVLGNHDFAVDDARKAVVPARMGIPQRYRDFVHSGWRFVLLDTNDLSLHAFAAGSPGQEHARAWRAERAAQGGESGGAVGVVQLLWLDAVLAAADAAGEFAVTMSHHPLLPAGPATAWNAAEVAAVLAAHPSVKLHLAGHDHAGSYAQWQGIHFLTLQGMLDTEENAYATVDLSREAIRVDGRGRVPDRELRPR